MKNFLKSLPLLILFVVPLSGCKNKEATISKPEARTQALKKETQSLLDSLSFTKGYSKLPCTGFITTGTSDVDSFDTTFTSNGLFREMSVMSGKKKTDYIIGIKREAIGKGATKGSITVNSRVYFGNHETCSVTKQFELQDYKYYLPYLLLQTYGNDHEMISENYTVVENSNQRFEVYEQYEQSGGMDITTLTFTLKDRLYTYNYNKKKYIKNSSGYGKTLLSETDKVFKYFYGENPYVSGLEQGTVYLNSSQVDESAISSTSNDYSAMMHFKKMNTLFREKGDLDLVTSIS